jgi:hypothetical protein
MIRLFPQWLDVHSAFSCNLDVDACVTYLVKCGWVNGGSKYAVVFEGCGVAHTECKLLLALVRQGCVITDVVFMDKELSSATLANIRDLPTHVYSKVYVCGSYKDASDFLRGSTDNVLVLGVHARYEFEHDEDIKAYTTFCQMCALHGHIPECVNFLAPYNPPLGPTATMHPLNRGTWVFHESWEARSASVQGCR